MQQQDKGGATAWSAEALARLSRAPATLRAYASDWRHFERWCGEAGHACLPALPSTVGAYLAAQIDLLSTATLRRRLSAILVRHRAAGCPLDRRDPAIRDVLTGILRLRGEAGTPKQALLADDIRLIVTALPSTLAGKRDAAIILLGYAGAFRRAELSALDRRDLRFLGPEGMTVLVRRSKEDPTGQGLGKAIPPGTDPAFCPVGAVKAWLIAAHRAEGPLFCPIDRHGNLLDGRLSGAAVAGVVKRAVARAGAQAGWSAADIDSKVAMVAGHSLRSGAIGQLAMEGTPEYAIARHAGQKSVATTRRYLRTAMPAMAPLHGKLGL